jgi:hypothetical protein
MKKSEPERGSAKKKKNLNKKMFFLPIKEVRKREAKEKKSSESYGKVRTHKIYE